MVPALPAASRCPRITSDSYAFSRQPKVSTRFVPGAGGGESWVMAARCPRRGGNASGSGRASSAQGDLGQAPGRSEEHTSELQSLMRNSYAVFCLKKKTYEKLV